MSLAYLKGPSPSPSRFPLLPYMVRNAHKVILMTRLATPFAFTMNYFLSRTASAPQGSLANLVRAHAVAAFRPRTSPPFPSPSSSLPPPKHPVPIPVPMSQCIRIGQ